LYAGAALQLVDHAEGAVLTIENSRLLQDPIDARQLTAGLDVGPAEVWWTEVVTPWGSDGDPGIEIAAGIARVLGGQLRVEDGT
jgi:hypothetical protein